LVLPKERAKASLKDYKLEVVYRFSHHLPKTSKREEKENLKQYL
jgi:hypothetical protein